MRKKTKVYQGSSLYSIPIENQHNYLIINSVDGDVQDEDAEYLEFLASQKIQENGEDSDDEIEEEILYQSPLDEIDPYECFEQVFRGRFPIKRNVD